jgi:DNA helicase-2/ATP-dependent DNA helicase PcrA
MDYLDQLNPPQREGVTNTEGPTMIIAGAGSGKTRVLTYRIAHLIEKGVQPYNILSLTFTNKAAKEMRDRVEKVVGAEARNLWMGTFHSVFARILRSEADKLGYPSNFTILDADDSKSLIKTIVKEMQLDDKIYKPNVVFNRISGAKNRLISWQEYNRNPVYRSDDESNMKPKLGEIYKTYAERCFKAGSMDFDDLLFNTNVLFKDHVDILNKYQQRFHYVMVDEFQDTNVSQYLITKKLAAVRQNICVVGDDAQSIYAFRGADITNILNFEKDYDDLKVIKLEQNYRSTKTIVNAANSVIGNNQAQLRKDVWTENEEGGLIEIIKASSDNEEGKLVASSIFEEKMHNQLRNSDFAILYRTNSQSRALEEALRRSNIKYKIIGGLSFYQRKEIKDLLAYLRFTVNHQDEISFRRIINLPKRGIGASSVDKILVAANENNITTWEVLNNITSFLSGRTANAIIDFVAMIKRFKIDIENKDAYEAAKSIANGSGLIKELYEDKTIEGLNRYENAQELLNAIKEYVDNPEVENKDLGHFLQEITLLTGVDQDDDEDQDKVTLMTVHMAKGLEFKYVYLPGMEENLFPSQMMLNSRTDLEEERRLFYVAITRAEKKVILCHALSRYKFGRIQNNEPSRFIDEIDAAFINSSSKHHTVNNMSTAPSSQYAKNLVQGIKAQQQRSGSNAKTSYVPSANFEPSDTSNLEEGMKVEHPKFGFGKVITIDVNGANKKAKVNFDNFGEKTLLLSFAKLKIH